MKTHLKNHLIGLLSAVALLAFVAGLPVLLVAIGADPVPHHIPSLANLRGSLTNPEDGTLALGAVTVIAWLAWAFLTLTILVEVAARARGIRAPRLPGLAVPQAAARGLVTAAALLFVAAPALQAATVAPAHAALAPPTASGTASPTHGNTNPRADQTARDISHEPHRQGPRQGRVTHVVRPGESLWSIARDRLGAGERYPEIATLNADQLGDDPDLVEPGWLLQLPATPDHPAAHAEPYRVKAGDTLSQIAQDKLGDAAAYPEIVAASHDLTQPGGGRLHDPDVIDVGWTLRIPGKDTKPSTKPPPRTPNPSPAARGHDDGGGQHGDPGGPSPTAPTHATPRDQDSAPAPRLDRSGGAAAKPHAADQPTAANDERAAVTTWLLAGLGGAGTVLAGSMWLLLRRLRREQFRGRRPGRTIAEPAPELAPVEKTVMALGAAPAEMTGLMDTMLRRLAANRTVVGGDMPSLAAVELTEDAVVLHLTSPADLSPPWVDQFGEDSEQCQEEGGVRLQWACSVDADLDQVGPQVEDQPAPYPLLVTLGATEAGEIWLFNCEVMGTLSITGDPTYAADFLRYLTAELAVNPWSRDITATCIGVCAEVAPMNPSRIHHQHTADQAAADPVPPVGPIGQLLTDSLRTLDRATEAGTDVATARAAQLGDDLWDAKMLILDLGATGTTQTAAADRGAGDPDRPHHGAGNEDGNQTLKQLINLGRDHPGHTGTAVILTGERPLNTDEPLGVVVHLSSTGRVSLPAAGLDLIAVGLTSDEAQGCAALIAQCEVLACVEVPEHATGSATEDAGADTDRDTHREPGQGWRAFADQAGGLRKDQTLPRSTPITNIDGPVNTVLPGVDEDYLRDSASTVEDLETLSPQVPDRVRSVVEAADPTLDTDVAAWFADDSDRPRLRLLGPVTARTLGKAIAKRKAHCTELLAYLVLHSHGATTAELADAFAITPARVRVDLKAVRDWLGTNPHTGEKHLPHATESAQAAARGVPVYQVDGVLVDADLFRRLRLRGEARGGTDGFADLCQALRLVTGRPFMGVDDHGGWAWLYEGDRVDHHLVVAVLDAAHCVTVGSLRAKNLTQARTAVDVAAKVAPHDEAVLLDLAAVTAAEGHHSEADRIVREDICNFWDDGEPPMDLTARTSEILRRWRAANDGAPNYRVSSTNDAHEQGAHGRAAS